MPRVPVGVTTVREGKGKSGLQGNEEQVKDEELMMCWPELQWKIEKTADFWACVESDDIQQWQKSLLMKDI